MPWFDQKLNFVVLVGVGMVCYGLFCYGFARSQTRAALAGLFLPRP